MVNVIPIGQKGNRFEIKPTERVIDVDGSVTEKPQNFTNYSKVEMIFRDPQGLKKTHEAVVTGGPVNIPLIGLRVDVPNQTIDDTHINDGNDGVIFPPSSYAVSPAPINDGNAETYIEIPERGTLVVTSSDIPFKFPNIVFWLFFRGLTGAQIQLRLQDFSAVDTFVSDVISPNATLPVSAGSTSAVVWQYIQRIQNLGTVTARYSGWDARITGTPTAPAIYNYTGAHIELAGYTRPFTFVEITKGKTLILKRATVQPNTDNLLLNVRGAALPSLRVHFYKQNILQGATDISSIDSPLSIPIVYEFDELHIEVLDDTNGVGIELGGISIQDGNGAITQITDWIEALITSPATFPFDEDLNTETQLTDGVWFFESIGTKTVKQIAITRPVGTTPNPDVEVQVLINGEYVRVGSYTPELTDDTPSLMPINDVPRSFEHLRLVSTASFQLHELVVNGTSYIDFKNGTIIFYDTEGIINKYGTWTYKGNTLYKDGTNLESLNASAVFAS